MRGKADGYRGLDHHDRIGIVLHDEVDDSLDSGGIKVVLLAVVVGGGGDHDEVRILVGVLCVEGSFKIQLLFSKILLDVVVLDGRFFVVDKLHLFGDDIHRFDGVMLCQKHGNRQADISGARYCDFHVICLFLNTLYFIKLFIPLRKPAQAFT